MHALLRPAPRSELRCSPRQALQTQTSVLRQTTTLRTLQIHRRASPPAGEAWPAGLAAVPFASGVWYPSLALLRRAPARQRRCCPSSLVRGVGHAANHHHVSYLFHLPIPSPTRSDADPRVSLDRARRGRHHGLFVRAECCYRRRVSHHHLPSLLGSLPALVGSSPPMVQLADLCNPLVQPFTGVVVRLRANYAPRYVPLLASDRLRPQAG